MEVDWKAILAAGAGLHSTTGCPPGLYGQILRLVTGLALSSVTGIRAVLPMFVLSLFHVTEGYALADDMAWLGHPVICVILGVLVLIEVIDDMIPAIDLAQDAVMTVIRPACGVLTVLAPYACGGWHVNVPVAGLGAGLALTMHVSKAGVRLGSSATTGGLCNPLLSIAETVITAVVAVLVVLFALFALIFSVLGIVLAIWGIRRLRARRAARAEAEARAREHALEEGHQQGYSPGAKAGRGHRMPSPHRLAGSPGHKSPHNFPGLSGAAAEVAATAAADAREFGGSLGNLFCGSPGGDSSSESGSGRGTESGSDNGSSSSEKE